MDDVYPRDSLNRAWGQLLLVVVVGVLLPLALVGWLGLALGWAELHEGENVICRCWADDHEAWEYGVQLVVAVIGFLAGALVVAMFWRRARRGFPKRSMRSG